MASFDSFETIREVYSDLNYTVYSARKSGDATSEYAIKLFPTPPAGREPESTSLSARTSPQAEDVATHWINIQERAAAASAFIAPILARGRDERGVWYATRFYSRSVNKMINGKVALPREALYHILRCIAQGALDLKRICGRGHGDIQASNIQISKNDKVSIAEVVLCDPLPDGEQAGRYEIRDLQAIGLMLLQLVRLRPIASTEVAQILPILLSPEWTQIFGKDAENWVTLCNRLLDPGLSLDQFTLEQLVARLSELEPKPIVPKKYIMPAVISGVFLVLIIMIWALWPSGPRPQHDNQGKTGQSPGTNIAGIDSGKGRTEATTNDGQTQTSNGTKRLDSVIELTAFPGMATILGSNQVSLGSASVERPLRLTNAPGTYLFTARSDDGLGELLSTNLVLRRRETNKFRFQFEYGAVSLTTVPGDATVILDGRQPFKTPAAVFLKPSTPTTFRIERPFYVPKTALFIVKSGATTNVHLTLDPEPVSVTLLSDPADANFFTLDGTKLSPSETNASAYWLPWGETNLVARHPRLGNQTNRVEIKAGGQNAPAVFRFDYGILMLSNLSKEVTVLEGDRIVGSAANQTVYEHTGHHTYTLNWGGSLEQVETNIVKGNNYLISSLGTKGWVTSKDRLWTNAYGIAFSWVTNLPWGGTRPGMDMKGAWVGRFELTQGQFKRIMGQNPSAYQRRDDLYDQHPVENVTWEQAMDFCRRLTSMDAAECSGWHYTLPTEDQFAYFVADSDRLGGAGTLGRITSEGRSMTRFDVAIPPEERERFGVAPGRNLGPRTSPERVGSVKSNQYSLYDVVGNVSEWLATGPSGRPNEKTYAGGSYLNFDFTKQKPPSKLRKTSTGKAPDIGFRVVLVPGQ